MKLGILKEGKMPPDNRVPLTPRQCKTLLNLYPHLSIEVESSSVRCFSDEEYSRQGVVVKDDISTCDFFLGVKEVPVEKLIAEKTYLFFSHTIKKQVHNRKMLQTILDKHIRLIDYELLTDKKGRRLIGFGHYAGLVGAYNAFLTYGKRYGFFELKPAHKCADKWEMMKELKRVQLPATKIAVTGNGRVAGGVIEIMEELAVRRLSVEEYLTNTYDEVCYVQLTPGDYNQHKGSAVFDLYHFYNHPHEYKSRFKRFCQHTDMLISAAYWNPEAPVLFTLDEMQDDDFNMKVIADITCDIGGSIPSTIRACRIGDPNYDFNPFTLKEEPAFSSENNVTMMTVDNLPNELPKDASREFGVHLMNRILDYVIKSDWDGVIERATIAEDGELNEPFKYLGDYVMQDRNHPT